MKNYNIKFINHSSFIVDDGKYKILTDPWFISSAFGEWYQNPFPKYNDIKKILLNKKKTFIIISHGHDDHLDDFFIKNYLSDCHIIIPDLKSKGFYKRIEKLTSKKIIEIKKGFNNPFKLGTNYIYNYSNDDMEHDSIFLISNKKDLIIHANDNYRVQPNNIIKEIKKISDKKNVYYFSQIGIANSFPICTNMTLKEKKHFIESEHKRFIKSFEKNINSVNANLALIYANQFNFDNIYNLSYFENVKKLISKKSNLHQLMPGDSIFKGKLIRNKKRDLNIFEISLKNLENLLNKYIKFKIKTKIKVKFLIQKDHDKKNVKQNRNIIYLICRTSLWTSIITGNYNLEVILIGGQGKIVKVKSQSMKYISKYISEYAYIYQNRICKNLELFK